MAAPRELGTVRRFNFGSGRGFVKTDAGDSDVFLNIPDVLDHGIPRIGDRVSAARRAPSRAERKNHHRRGDAVAVREG
jgi:cold shock CspA family protein